MVTGSFSRLPAWEIGETICHICDSIAYVWCNFHKSLRSDLIPFIIEISTNTNEKLYKYLITDSIFILILKTHCVLILYSNWQLQVLIQNLNKIYINFIDLVSSTVVYYINHFHKNHYSNVFEDVLLNNDGKRFSIFRRTGYIIN